MASGHPDFITEVTTLLAEADSIRGGLDANKSATPVAREIYLATDTSKLYFCIVDGTWIGVNILLNTVSQSQPVRAMDTIYQNTSDKIRLVTVSVELEIIGDAAEIDGRSGVDYECDNVTPPVVVVAESRLEADDVAVANASNKLDAYQTVTFVVPPDYYYRAVSDSALQGQAPNLLKWTEWDLH